MAKRVFWEPRFPSRPCEQTLEEIHSRRAFREDSRQQKTCATSWNPSNQCSIQPCPLPYTSEHFPFVTFTQSNRCITVTLIRKKKGKKIIHLSTTNISAKFYDAKIKINLLKIIFNLQDFGDATQLKIVCYSTYKILIEKIFKLSSMSDIGKIGICLW